MTLSRSAFNGTTQGGRRSQTEKDNPTQTSKAGQPRLAVVEALPPLDQPGAAIVVASCFVTNEPPDEATISRLPGPWRDAITLIAERGANALESWSRTVRSKHKRGQESIGESMIAELEARVADIWTSPRMASAPIRV